MKTYTTSDICKGLGLVPETLRDWMLRGFVRPSVPSPGQGQRAEFSRWDIYRVELFRQMLARGFKRGLASQFIRTFDEEGEKFPTEHITFIVRGEDVKVLTWAEGLTKEHISSTILSGLLSPPIDYDSVHTFNFGKIKSTVDSAVG